MDVICKRIKSKKESSWLWYTTDHNNSNVIAYVIGSIEYDML